MASAVQRLAGVLAPETTTATVLVAGVAVVVASGLLRAPHRLARRAGAAAFVLLGAAPFLPLPTGVPSWTMAVAAAVALLVDVVLDADRFAEPRAARASRAAPLWTVGAVAAAAVLMLHDLGGYAGSLQRWEASVVYGFGHAFTSGQDAWSYAKERLVWNNGILSLGNQSLFYGAPAYAFFHVAGFSPWTLRFPAVVTMLANVVVIHALARRFFGPLVAAAAAVLLGLNACALFYGRYGSSPAGTMLAVLLAVAATWSFLEHDRSAWWLGAVCAVAFFAATLQYAAARIVVLILLAFIPLMLACQWRRLGWRRLVGFAILVVAAVAVWHAEGPSGGQSVVLSGQGEQYFYMRTVPDFVAHFCPECASLLPDRRAYELALLRRWLMRAVPEYLTLVLPGVQKDPLRDWDVPVLPHLYFGPLVVFIAWGLRHSLLRWRSMPHTCLLLWVAGATVPLLLTSRVDSHRVMLLVIPATLWGALGVWEAARLLHDVAVPMPLGQLLAVALALSVVVHDVRLLWAPPGRGTLASDALAAEAERAPGPVAVGAVLDPPFDTAQNLELVELRLLERQRRDPARPGALVPDPLVSALRDGGATPPDASVAELRRLLEGATVLLGPADPFRPAAAALATDGVSVEDVGPAGFPILRLARGVVH